MSKDDGRSKLSDKHAAIQWGLKLAWKIDKRMAVSSGAGSACCWLYCPPLL